MVVDCGSSGSRVYIFKEDGDKFVELGKPGGVKDKNTLLAEVIS